MSFGDLIEGVGKVVDAAGVVIIIVGVLIATGLFVQRWRRRNPPIEAAYRGYRQAVGRAILLGLEFLVAGDIIRTVAASPTFRSAGVLAVIVAIRTFLSLELELEIDGRWPWQRGPSDTTPPRNPPDSPSI